VVIEHGYFSSILTPPASIGGVPNGGVRDQLFPARFDLAVANGYGYFVVDVNPYSIVPGKVWRWR
jgi:hypothetical protein